MPVGMCVCVQRKWCMCVCVCVGDRETVCVCAIEDVFGVCQNSMMCAV